MYRDNSLGSLINPFLYLGCVYVASVRVNVDQYGSGPHQNYGFNSGKEGIRHRDYLIPGSDITGKKSQMQGLCSRTHSDTEFSTAIRGEPGLKSLNILTQEELHPVKATAYLNQYFFFDTLILSLKID